MTAKGPIQLFVATKAFILNKGKVLIIRESGKYRDGTHTGIFDLVGGRITPGQPFNKSLQREIREETSLRVKIGNPFFVSEWRPVVRGQQWQIIGIFFLCKALNTKVKLSRDHDAYKWIDPKSFKKERMIVNLHKVFKAYLN